jgi:probable addiction module antidote protein
MKTTPFDVQDHLRTPDARAAYLEAILEDGDVDLIAAGLGEIARAMGASELAREAGISREAIYKGLAPGGNPTLDTLARITKAMGLRLTVAPAKTGLGEKLAGLLSERQARIRARTEELALEEAMRRAGRKKAKLS